MTTNKIMSGEYSRKMWNEINILRIASTTMDASDVSDVLYLIGCRLQELENKFDEEIEKIKKLKNSSRCNGNCKCKESDTKLFPDWFGKGCEFLTAQWEETELTSGRDFMEYEPVLTLCRHSDNESEYEGNCNKDRCPLNK